jgi:hypothetical protein
MSYKILICALLISLALATAGCVAQNSASGNGGLPALPKENLPQGFAFLAEKNSSTGGVNITEEIKDFYGQQDIGPVDAVVGIYTWAPLGQGYDSKITYLALQDNEHAQAAVTNYKSLPEYRNPPYRGVDRFSNAIINGHDVTQIMDVTGDGKPRYLYLWDTGNLVVLVEGNESLGQSRDLASATGL